MGSLRFVGWWSYERAKAETEWVILFPFWALFSVCFARFAENGGFLAYFHPQTAVSQPDGSI
jgi:hypothetical protein